MGKETSQNLTIYIASTKRYEKKIQFLFNLNNLCTSTIYLTTSQTSSRQHLAKFVAFQAPTSLCCSLGNQPIFNWEIPQHNCAIHHRPSTNCMHHLYNSKNYTIDSTLTLNSNINWVFLKIDMHELFMSGLSINQLSTKVFPHCQTSYQFLQQLELV